MFLKIFVFFLSIILTLILYSYVIDKKRTEKEIMLDFKPMNIKFPVYEKENRIPLNAYRIYGLRDGKGDLEKYQNSFDESTKNCPGLKNNIIFGKKEMDSFILKYYNQEVLDIVNLINHEFSACVADVFRLLIIYAKGGVYLDIKSKILKDIVPDLEKYNDKLIVSPFCHIPFIFTGWTKVNFPYGEISNWFFAAPKGHPVLREAIQQTLTNIKMCYERKEFHNQASNLILSMTGPDMLSDVINKTYHQQEIQKLNSFTIKDIFKPTFLGWEGKIKKENEKINNSKIQGKNHWKKMKKNLFV